MHALAILAEAIGFVFIAFWLLALACTIIFAVQRRRQERERFLCPHGRIIRNITDCDRCGMALARITARKHNATLGLLARPVVAGTPGAVDAFERIVLRLPAARDDAEAADWLARLP